MAVRSIINESKHLLSLAVAKQLGILEFTDQFRDKNYRDELFTKAKFHYNSIPLEKKYELYNKAKSDYNSMPQEQKDQIKSQFGTKEESRPWFDPKRPFNDVKTAIEHPEETKEAITKASETASTLWKDLPTEEKWNTVGKAVKHVGSTLIPRFVTPVGSILKSFTDHQMNLIRNQKLPES